MAKIGFEIKNYKKIKDLHLNLDEYDAIIVDGPNRGGKTSLLNGIFENLTAKNLSDEPLSRDGSKSGEKSVIVEDKNGKEIKIVHTFEKKSPKGTFYAIQDGKKISSVNKIRELIGDANVYDINELFTMCKSTAGRRTFIKEIIMKTLTEAQLKEIEEINLEINPKTGNLYTKRADYNKSMEILKATPGLTDEEKALLKTKDSIVANETKSNEEIKSLTNKKSILSIINTNILAIENGAGWQTLKEEDIIFKDPDAKQLFINLILNEKQALKYKDVVYNGMNKMQELINLETIKLNDSVNKLKNIENIEYKAKDYEGIDKKISDLQEEIDKINKDMNTQSDRKDTILSESKLPKGLVIEGESDFTYNGFDFDQSNISESEAWILLAQLTIPIYDCKYFRMGNASIYGKEALNAIMEIASENGKILALERVNDDRDDLFVEGIVWDEEPKEELKKELEIDPIAVAKADKANEEVKEEIISSGTLASPKETTENQAKKGDEFFEKHSKRIAEQKAKVETPKVLDPLAANFDTEKENFDEGKAMIDEKIENNTETIVEPTKDTPNKVEKKDDVTEVTDKDVKIIKDLF